MLQPFALCLVVFTVFHVTEGVLSCALAALCCGQQNQAVTLGGVC